MFDWIWNALSAIGEALLPFVVLQPYESGVLCRLGTFKRVLGPGFHWVFPFHIDRVWDDHITPRTEHLSGLATTTKDGKSIGFDAIVTYRIKDIEKAVLRVTHVQDAIADTCMGIIGTELSNATWEDVLHGKATESLTSACRERGWKWGVEIMSVQLAGVALVRNFRLSGSAQHLMHATTPSGV
jgi:regulator of protease activity HflC (stomatin/prohibitin superfamily)